MRNYLFTICFILFGISVISAQSRQLIPVKNSVNAIKEPLILTGDTSSGKSYTVMMDANKFTLPMNNRGFLADVDNISGKYGESWVLYSGGFYLSGKAASRLWANGVLSSSLISDYIAGKVNTDTLQSYIYTVKRNWPEFGPSWQNWRAAVASGALFYDGNNDGIYNPVDLNNNGKWDPSEDRPDIIGDQVSWCVFNDGLPAARRRYTDINPLGIEIVQTAFASGDTFSLGQSAIFLRYSLQNTGSVAAVLDSVYFSVAADFDIGDFSDDLVGCDTIRAAGYGYQKSNDARYGSNPPAIYLKILQGPYSYIAGKTFTDNNNNGVYDAGIDTPLDTARQYYGSTRQPKLLPGAKNLPLTSLTQYIGSHPTQGDPNSAEELRNYQLGGKMKNGQPRSACTWDHGSVFGGVQCALINSDYMYSGSPIDSIGWLNTRPNDQRMIATSGPFKLETGKPVDIIAAYIIARGSSGLNSVETGARMNDFIRAVYNSNFTSLPLSTADKKPAGNPVEFMLRQNYPNPFNPSTIVECVMPRAGKLSLIVYDILGREISVLANGWREAGSYKHEFNASELAAGVYICRMDCGGFSQSKKLVYIK